MSEIPARDLLRRADHLRQSRYGLMHLIDKKDLSACCRVLAEVELATTERVLAATEKQMANLVRSLGVPLA